MERSGLRFENFCSQRMLNHRGGKSYFTDNFNCSLCLNVFLPPLLKVQYPNFLDLQNPWGKIMEWNGLGIWKLLLTKGVKLPRKKNSFFAEFCLTYRIFLVSVLLSALVKKCFVSRMRVFVYTGLGSSRSSAKNRVAYRQLELQLRLFCSINRL